jgi:hypothetical protein
MKFNDFQFEIHWEWFFILPTIVVIGKDYRYIGDNFSIEVHWLVWHMRWRWIKE